MYGMDDTSLLPIDDNPEYVNVPSIKGGRVMIAFFVNYSTVAFPLHLPTLKRQQFFGAVANSLGKKFIFPATVGRAALCGAVWRQPVKRWMLAKRE